MGAERVRPDPEVTPTRNYRSGTAGPCKWEVWTGGTLYQTRAPIDVVVRLSATKAAAHANLTIRRIDAILSFKDGKRISSKEGIQPSRVTEPSPTVRVFQYDDFLAEGPIPLGELILEISAVLEDRRQWSTRLPMRVVPSPGERKGTKE
jgi:hypothetical protein